MVSTIILAITYSLHQVFSKKKGGGRYFLSWQKTQLDIDLYFALWQKSGWFILPLERLTAKPLRKRLGAKKFIAFAILHKILPLVFLLKIILGLGMNHLEIHGTQYSNWTSIPKHRLLVKIDRSTKFINRVRLIIDTRKKCRFSVSYLVIKCWLCFCDIQNLMSVFSRFPRGIFLYCHLPKFIHKHKNKKPRKLSRMCWFVACVCLVIKRIFQIKTRRHLGKV